MSCDYLGGGKKGTRVCIYDGYYPNKKGILVPRCAIYENIETGEILNHKCDGNYKIPEYYSKKGSNRVTRPQRLPPQVSKSLCEGQRNKITKKRYMGTGYKEGYQPKLKSKQKAILLPKQSLILEPLEQQASTYAPEPPSELPYTTPQLPPLPKLPREAFLNEPRYVEDEIDKRLTKDIDKIVEEINAFAISPADGLSKIRRLIEGVMLSKERKKIYKAFYNDLYDSFFPSSRQNIDENGNLVFEMQNEDEDEKELIAQINDIMFSDLPNDVALNTIANFIDNANLTKSQRKNFNRIYNNIANELEL